MTNITQIDNKLEKTVSESEAETIIMMLPSDANPMGNVFGGIILMHVDLIAGLVAKRHAGHANIVTASMDSMTFLKPVFIGNALILKARLNYIKKSSMEVEVYVQAEDLNKSQKVHTGTAYVTLVALDDKGKPTAVPKMILRTKEEEERYREGEKRMEERLKNRKKNAV